MKRAWEMTKEEWRVREINSCKSEIIGKRGLDKALLKFYLKQLIGKDEEVFNFHKEEVRKAWERGEVIPKEVLDEYSSLFSNDEKQLIYMGYTISQIRRVNSKSSAFIIENRLKPKEVSIRWTGGLKVFREGLLSLDDECLL